MGRVRDRGRGALSWLALPGKRPLPQPTAACGPGGPGQILVQLERPCSRVPGKHRVLPHSSQQERVQKKMPCTVTPASASQGWLGSREAGTRTAAGAPRPLCGIVWPPAASQDWGQDWGQCSGGFTEEAD